ncbi:tetratricopeptide repeat protein [Bdellovibrio sp. HCB337]|uniref:tetratricopeptide repeat protein n=1 Tax=Bdellovibrio sp. HCB337 TaxID=3394358 RepID=UPI0039A628F9
MRQYFILTVTFVLSLSTVSAEAAKKVKDSMSKDALMIELTGKDPSKVSESALYGEIFNAYRSNDEIGFKSRMQTFMTRFPASSYADNVTYLAGRLAFDGKNYAEAIKYYQKVITQYPRSNKVVAAKYAKAVAYKKMNLDPQAKGVFADLRKKYPGSPEAFRAENELKLMR